MTYLWAFALTVIVEVPIYTGLLGTAGLLRPVIATVMGIAVNLVTHPLVWLAVQHAGPAYWQVLWPTEGAAWLTEAGAPYAAARRRPGLLLVISLIANTASLLAGLTVNAITRLHG